MGILKTCARTAAIWAARSTPTAVKKWLHSRRSLDGASRRIFGSMVGGEPVAIKEGPMAGLLLVPGEHVSHAHLRGVYEQATLQAVDRLVKPGMVCYDLGASIGYLSLLMAREAKKVYAFEPAPHANQEIRKHAGANRMENITIVPEAVSDYEGEATFGLTDVAYGSGIVEGETRWPTITVKVTTLDAFAQVHEPPAFIKIDVEGAEGRVLAGAPNLLSRTRPVLCCELHSQEAAQRVQEILAGHGYTISTLEGRPFVIDDWIGPGEVHVICQPQPLSPLSTVPPAA
jgi:FkbM family methyltransferase